MVRDVAASIQFYQLLGFEPAFGDAPVEPKYAGVRRDGVELHLQWHEAKDFSQGDRPTYRFVVPELASSARKLSGWRRVDARIHDRLGRDARSPPARRPANTSVFHRLVAPGP